MWSIGIPAICLLAHLLLVILFQPSFWREIDRRGLRWQHAISLFVVPPALILFIAAHVLANLATLPDWLLLLAFLAVDALILVLVLAATRLVSRRRRPT